MPRKVKVHPYQQNMFESLPTAVGTDFMTGNTLLEERPTKIYPDGPSVSIAQRTASLLGALDELAQINKSRGLADILTRPVLSDTLVDRYGASTSNVVQGNLAKVPKRETRARQHFAVAFGLPQLIDSGLMTEKEAKQLAASSYEKFSAEKGRGIGAPVRDVYKRKLERTARIATTKATR